MEKVLLGDNQFFGINHMSDEQARASEIRFQKDEAIMEVIDAARCVGINTFMCTTHERVAGICKIIRSNPERYRDFQIYPCMPYAHKYANAVSESGMIGALMQFLPEKSAFASLFKNGVAVAKRDINVLIGSLIDAEMRMFEGISTPVIFLQNVVSDLMLGLGFYQALRTFAIHVRVHYAAEPGFITMNLPQMLEALEIAGIKNPIVCSNINKIGFRMSGGTREYETLLKEREFRPVAMSVFASGAIPPEQAIEYVCSQQRVESVVFGASNAVHIKQTKRLIDHYFDHSRVVDNIQGAGNGYE